MPNAAENRRILFPPDVQASLHANAKAHTIATSCLDYFNRHPKALDTFVRTLKRQGHFSLRILDWFVTNYSKRVRMQIRHHGFWVDLHADYRRHLNVYTKRFFDPFARRERISIVVMPGDERLLTTVGQINFLKWMAERGVDARVQEAKHNVETDMKALTEQRQRQDNHKDKNKDRDRDASDDQYLLFHGPFRIHF